MSSASHFPNPPPPRKPLGASTAHASNRRAPSSPVLAPKPPQASSAAPFGLFSLASSVTQSVLGALDDVAAHIDDAPPPYEDYTPPAAASSYDEFVARAAPSPAHGPPSSAPRRRSASAPRSAGSAARLRAASRAPRARTRSPSPPPLLGLLSEVGSSLGSAYESTVSGFGSSVGSGLELSVGFGVGFVGLVDRWLDDTLGSVLGGAPAPAPVCTPTPGRTAHAERPTAPLPPWAFRSRALSILEAEACGRMRALSAEPSLILCEEDIAPDVSARVRASLSASELDALLPMARAAIGGDARLLAARQALVPKRLRERAFWASYLRRCLTIKKEVVLEFGRHALALAAGEEGTTAVSDAELAQAWARELELTVPAPAGA